MGTVSRLEVQVFQTRRSGVGDEAVDVLQVTARNAEGRATTLGGCAVVLPLGLLVFSDPPLLEYPFRLETGAQCSDVIDCRLLAERARDSGYPGKVRVQAVFLEVGPLAPLPADPFTRAHPAEHRSDGFVFDAAGWR
jgi:hypothetical protein